MSLRAIGALFVLSALAGFAGYLAWERGSWLLGQADPELERSATLSPGTEAAPIPEDWQNMSASPGDWGWSEENGRSTARFSDDMIIMACEPTAAAVTLSLRTHSQRLQANDSNTLTILTDTKVQTLKGERSGEALAITLAANDPLLDAMTFSRGRFGLLAGGGTPVVIRNWAEIARVIEDCRMPE